jgi:hypothetical protein
MKTRMKLFTLVFFLSLSTISKAQEATLEETVNWIFAYGTKLFQESTTLFFTMENEEMKLYYRSKYDGYSQECNFKWSDIRAVAAFNGEKSVLVFAFKTDLDGIIEKEKTKFNDINFYFKCKDDLMRFYKAIEHLFKLIEVSS